MSPRGRAMANVAVASASLALIILLIELGARAYVARSLRPHAAGGSPISRFSPTLGWDKPPGGDQWIRREEYNVHILLNAKGLRGPDRDYPKPPGTRRILMLGDSFAEGYYVDEEATARAVLERRLNQRGCAKYEVVNAAVPGYSTDQEYLLYLEEAHRYEPDLVAVFFYYNDLYYNTQGVGTAGRPKPYFVLAGNQLLLRNSPLPRPPDTSPEAAGRNLGRVPWPFDCSRTAPPKAM